MFDVDVNEQAKRFESGLRTSAHRVWLAGLGAVALAEEEGKGLVDGSKTFFNELIERGRKLEGRSRQGVDKARREAGRMGGTMRGKVEKNLDQISDEVDRRVSGALHRIGVPTRTEIETLTRRVEELTAKVTTRAAKAAGPAGLKLYHVRWEGEQWKVDADGGSRATSVHPTKDEAVTAARELAHGQEPSQVIVYKMDGSEQNRFTYQPAEA